MEKKYLSYEGTKTFLKNLRVELTQAEYLLLEKEGKIKPGTEYFIIDGDVSNSQLIDIRIISVDTVTPVVQDTKFVLSGGVNLSVVGEITDGIEISVVSVGTNTFTVNEQTITLSDNVTKYIYINGWKSLDNGKIVGLINDEAINRENTWSSEKINVKIREQFNTPMINDVVTLGKMTKNVNKVYSNAMFAENAGFQIGGGSSVTQGETPDGLYIDTGTSGKWYQRNDVSWGVQINTGTKLYIPVLTPGTIKIKTYIKGEITFTVTENDFKYISGKPGVYYLYTSDENDYINSIVYSAENDFGLKCIGKDTEIAGILTVGEEVKAPVGKFDMLTVNGKSISFQEQEGALVITYNGKNYKASLI